MDIYLIRHTRVQGMEGICYGRSDAPLGPSFVAEAAAVKRQLAALRDPAVYSSPATRCRSLAEQLASGNFTVTAQLAEMDFGKWEMQPWDSIPRRELDLWAGDYENIATPGGESLQDLSIRVLAFWDQLAHSDHPEAVVVSHGGPIRVILAKLRNLPAREMFAQPVGFGSIRKVTLRDGKVDAILDFRPA